jgi:hypothetical protein
MIIMPMHAYRPIVGRRDSLSNHLEIEKCLHLPQANEDIITSNTKSYPKPPIGRIMISVPRSLCCQHTLDNRDLRTYNIHPAIEEFLKDPFFSTYISESQMSPQIDPYEMSPDSSVSRPSRGGRNVRIGLSNVYPSISKPAPEEGVSFLKTGLVRLDECS